MKKQFLSIAIVAATALAANSSFAQDTPEWNYVEGSIESLSVDDSDDIKPLGFGLSASYLITDNIFVDGSYSRLSDDVGDVDVDLTTFDLNIGYRYGLTSSTDVYGSLGYLSADIEARSPFGRSGEDDDGLAYKVGLRSKLNEQFEVDASVSHERLGDFSDNLLALSGHYYINEQFAIGTSIKTNGDDEQLALSVRYAF